MSVPPSPGHPHDLSDQDRHNENFCNSIDVVLVERLAARHNGDKFCRISCIAVNGYTFSCYKVVFPDDGEEWVVRITVPSLLGNEWDVVRTEVATTRYLQRHTSIPVPTVRAYGTGERLTSDPFKTQSWIISDRLRGKPLTNDHLFLMTREKRLRCFSQLGDVLAQLQELTFPKTGSMYPDESDDTKEQIGPSLCRADQILAIRDGVVRSRPTFTTAWDSIEHHLMATRGPADLRVASRSNEVQDEIARQVVALDAVNRHVRDENQSFWREDRGFSLSHPSLISDRIFVDDDGNIQGIVQWAFTEILPRQLCHPPDLVLGTCSTPRERQFNDVWKEFLEAITPDHSYHKHLQYYLDNEKHIGFSCMLRSPTYATIIYFWDKVYDAQHQQPPKEMMTEFFSKPENQAELDRRVADQKQHSDDVIVRQASAMEPKLEKVRNWFMAVQDLVITASKSGNYIYDPFSVSPVLSAHSGGSPVPSRRSSKSAD
ncbi:Protein kinase-like domain protein [Akanthomyces lecanii RCEF 1005]|uniref:Protein kinase-like domain protein n=1 Tax=Akanthomyces lecanii RCEF 1005 TaxID=1081108 RepID=A0A167TSC7_CORDF|nr:Protein kinase-like domain protein [Akanthomyces lecanii RCEF 1005]